MHRVHIIEDDPEISTLLSTYLGTRGFDCQVSESAEAGQTLPPGNFDILIIDIMLPGENGLSFCRWVRENSEVPIIILSAVKGHTERIIGIELGADDYLEKPFNPRELLARMNALIRRAKSTTARTTPPGKSLFSGWVLDRLNQKLHAPGGIHAPLSSGEYSLISSLVDAAPNPITREELARIILGIDIGPEDRRVDILVSRLRKKLNALDPTADFIRTVRNQGYQFCADCTALD